MKREPLPQEETGGGIGRNCAATYWKKTNPEGCWKVEIQCIIYSNIYCHPNHSIQGIPRSLDSQNNNKNKKKKHSSWSWFWVYMHHCELISSSDSRKLLCYGMAPVLLQTGAGPERAVGMLQWHCWTEAPESKLCRDALMCIRKSTDVIAGGILALWAAGSLPIAV